MNMSCEAGRKGRLEAINLEYAATFDDDTIVELPSGSCGLKNEKKRKALREEYVSLLADDKRLAVHLHNKFCKCGGSSGGCTFHQEMYGVADIWEQYEHQEYLKKAKALLGVLPDCETLIKLIDVL